MCIAPKLLYIYVSNFCSKLRQSFPSFNFSGGNEGDPSFDRYGRVQEATQSDWNSYFRATETIELAYDSAGDVVLDQLVVSLISNDANPVNTGEVELEEEE